MAASYGSMMQIQKPGGTSVLPLDLDTSALLNQGQGTIDHVYLRSRSKWGSTVIGDGDGNGAGQIHSRHQDPPKYIRTVPLPKYLRLTVLATVRSLLMRFRTDMPHRTAMVSVGLIGETTLRSGIIYRCP